MSTDGRGPGRKFLGMNLAQAACLGGVFVGCALWAAWHSTAPGRAFASSSRRWRWHRARRRNSRVRTPMQGRMRRRIRDATTPPVLLDQFTLSR